MRNKFQFNSSSNQTQQPFGQSIKDLWKATRRFMVQRPRASAQSPTIAAKDRYSSKAGLYAYLSDNEEQRDWLERIYHD